MHFTQRYGAQILKTRISKTLVWERGGLHVRYAIARIGQEHFMWVQPLAGNLREILDSSGEGMIYRHGYSTPDIEKAYDELMVAGERFGHFSIEILEEKALEAFIEDAENNKCSIAIDRIEHPGQLVATNDRALLLTKHSVCWISILDQFAHNPLGSLIRQRNRFKQTTALVLHVQPRSKIRLNRSSSRVG